MQAEKTKTILALAVIAGAVSFLYFSMTPVPPKGERLHHLGLGQVMAEEAVKLLGNGGKITIFTRDTSVFKNPSIDFQLAGFMEAIGKSKASISATNLITLDPLYLPRVPAGDLLLAIRKMRDTDVIVSFLGPPQFTEDQKGKLGEKLPKIVAVCSGSLPRQLSLKDLFAQNLLHAAIISRPNPGATPPKTDNPRVWFEHYFQLITQTNLNDLPGPPEPSAR